MRACLAFFGCLFLSGCVSIPAGRSFVSQVQVEGEEQVSASEIQEKLATHPSPKFLGLFRGLVYDYEVLDRHVLQRDLQRIERFYRAKGFYQARVRAGRLYYRGDNGVRVEIEVDEGPATRIRRVDVHGVDSLPLKLREEIKSQLDEHVALSDILEEERFQAAERELLRVLTSNGYAYAQVRRVAEVDLPGNYAALRFDVEPFQAARYGEVIIRGLEDIPEAPVRRVLDLSAGAPYSSAELEAARQALLDLGVFNSVSVEPKLAEVPGSVVPIEVEVQPSKLHQLRLGIGSQVDVLRTDVHLLAGWDHRNFLGGLRRLSVEARPGLVFYPTRFPSFDAPTDFLPELKSRAELHQPGFLEARTNAFLRADYNVYAALLSPEVDESAPVLGYRELKANTGVERSFWRVYGRPSYHIGVSTPFTYVGQLDPDLGRVLVSYIELFSSLDYRDDRVTPRSGVYLSNVLQLAGGLFGGDAQDYKIKPEARFYVPLSSALVVALRGTVGLAFPQNYGESTDHNARYGNAPDSFSRKDWVRDVQVGFFRSFFAGGPSSNRGYPVRGIGPHGVVPFYSPELAEADLDARCQGAGASDARCLVPLGGFTLWEASTELRFGIAGPLSGAGFCDAADVSPNQVELRFDRLHLACGLGLRYATPVGPIRGDIGYRIPGLQTLGEDYGEGDPSALLGLPVAVSIAIGEAF